MQTLLHHCLDSESNRRVDLQYRRANRTDHIFEPARPVADKRASGIALVGCHDCSSFEDFELTKSSVQMIQHLLGRSRVAKNRFEQVDELQPDAINLTLIQKSDGQVGIVHCPKTAAPDRVPADLTTPEIPVSDAVVGAIQLANSKKIPIVVIDRDNIWKSEWGDLWRYQEQDE
jgi:hypothetical protein